MGETTAQNIFKDLEKGITKPFYLVTGEEPFQMAEIQERVKGYFVKGGGDQEFNFETWDGEGLKGVDFLASLEMLPGLFAEESSKRFILCQRFEKVSASELEKLEAYFDNPCDSTCLFLTATKIDKRKSWVKRVMAKGDVVEVAEPYDRDWPKWQSYFEKKVGKRISGNAWPMMVEASNRTLSLLWSETQKAALFVGEKNEITESDVKILFSGTSQADIFRFAEDVVQKRKAKAMADFHRLVQGGENEIKILSIIVRQFRMVDQCLRLLKSGVRDNRVIAKEIGSHPFFVSGVIEQAQRSTSESLGNSLNLLAECDYRMKRGETDLFRGFLLPYFSA